MAGVLNQRNDLSLPEEGLTEATAGFEPAHKGFADPCLTTWLRRRGRHTAPQPSVKTPTAGGDRPPSQSGRWDSNPRPSPWQGDVLPLNYTRWAIVERRGGYRDSEGESSFRVGTVPSARTTRPWSSVTIRSARPP